MVQLKLTLKSNRPSTIYASNGKAYKLQPGSNTLNLEYDDYLALAKTLLIKPVAPKPADKNPSTAVDNKEFESKVDKNENEESREQDEKPVDDICKSEFEKESESKNIEGLKESHVEESVNESFEHDETYTDKPAEESSGDTCESHTEENDEHLGDEVVDYSTWSYTDLKAKYKEVTGKSCKLKKDEIISFLQEHANNAE